MLRPPHAEAAAAAAANYQQYAEGHVNDHAPSLRTQSLLESGYRRVLWESISYGRPGTPMGPFLDEVGGPLTGEQINDMSAWFLQMAEVEPLEMDRALVEGDAVRGAELYAAECAQCHGAEGEGGTGTALGNPAMLALSPDHFLRHAIVNGRQGTAMPAFGSRLQDQEIDDVTAFLRSRSTGWTLTKPVYRAPPSREDYVTNPDGADPDFQLADGR